MSHEPKTIIVLAVVVGLIALMVVLGSQCQSCRQMAAHVQSGISGLDRRITLYAVDGSVIREWEGKYNIEVKGSSARFLDGDDAITISGTFIIEENPEPKEEKNKKKK